jgi:hypothetical protein
MPDTQLEVVSAENPVSEEERQVEGYHKALHALFKGSDDIIVAQSVASFMGCTMAHSEQWQRLIPGYVQQTLDYANVALAAHKQAETIEQPNTEGLHNGNEETQG